MSILSNELSPNALTDEAFAALTPANKKRYLNGILAEARAVKAKMSPRSGTSHGFAALWINVYGSGKVAKAFKRFLPKTGEKVMRNYRGATFAWYHGIQSDVGKYDALMEVSKLLSSYGIECYLDDAWD